MTVSRIERVYRGVAELGVVAVAVRMLAGGLTVLVLVACDAQPAASPRDGSPTAVAGDAALRTAVSAAGGSGRSAPVTATAAAPVAEAEAAEVQVGTVQATAAGWKRDGWGGGAGKAPVRNRPLHELGGEVVEGGVGGMPDGGELVAEPGALAAGVLAGADGGALDGFGQG